MQHWSGGSFGRTVFVRLDNGDDFLESLQQVLQESNIRFGVVVSGIATFKRCRLHQVQHTDYPPQESILELNEALEVMNVDGIIADGQLHIHCTVATRDGKTYGGHVEPGCTVLYLAEVCIAEVNDVKMSRRADESTRNIALLFPDKE